MSPRASTSLAAHTRRSTAAVQLAEAMGGSYRAHEQLQAACLDLLRLRKVPARPIHTGPRVTPRVGGGFELRRNTAQHGVADVFACLPAGLLLLIDFKTGGARLSKEQNRLRAEFEKAGALYAVIRSVDELAELLDRYVPRPTRGGR